MAWFPFIRNFSGTPNLDSSFRTYQSADGTARTFAALKLGRIIALEVIAMGKTNTALWTVLQAITARFTQLNVDFDFPFDYYSGQSSSFPLLY